MKDEKNSALPEAQGLLKELEKSLNGKNGYIWLGALKKFCRQEIPTWVPMKKWDVWNHIFIGKYESAEHAKTGLGENGMSIGDRTYTISKSLHFGKFNMYGVDIAMVDIIDLGFDENQEVAYRDIVKAAIKQGLQKCAPHDAFAIRQIYADQPIQQRCDEYHVVVSRPTNGGLFWVLNTGGDRTLSSLYFSPETKLNKYSKLFFRLTSKN
jgi:hypothetical protein